MGRLIKVIITISILAAGVFFLASRFMGKNVSTNEQKPQAAKTQNESPKVISTKPDPLEDNIVGASDPIEITFNKSLENVGEFKVRIEPKVEFKTQLSSDRKTGKIVFKKPLELGMTYTLFIEPDTKFDGVGNWGQEKIFHFKTIVYRGV